MSKQVSWNFTPSNSAKEYISISPQKELNFLRQGDKYISQLHLTNLSPKPVFYKIRTTAAKFYVVNPTAGRFLPREKRTITIIYPFRDGITERHEDKFLIQAFPDTHHDYEHVNNVKDVLAVFQEFAHSSDLFQSIKMKVHFEVQEIDAKKENSLKSNSIVKSDGLNTPTKSQSKLLDEIHQNHLKTASTSESIKKEDDFGSKIFDQNYEVKEFGSIGKEKTYIKHIQAKSLGSVDTQKHDRVSQKPTPEKSKKLRDDPEEIRVGIYKTPAERASLQDLQTLTPKSLIRSEVIREKNSFSGGSGNDSISSPKKGLILKQKLLQLNDKYRKQKIELDTLISEKVQYTEELNKLKFIYSKELAEPVPEGKLIAKPKANFQAWQLLLVSVSFLIIGSLVFS